MAAPAPTPLPPRSVPVLTGHRAGPAFRSRPSTDQYGGSTGTPFRFRGSGAWHSPGAAPLLVPGSGRGRGAGRGGGTCALSVTGGRGAGGAVPAERWEGCVWPGRWGGLGRYRRGPSALQDGQRAAERARPATLKGAPGSTPALPQPMGAAAGAGEAVAGGEERPWAGPNRAQPKSAEPDPSSTEMGRTEPSRTEPSRAQPPHRMRPKLMKDLKF